MADPQDRVAMQDIRRISGKDIIPYISSIGEINQSIDSCYSSADLNKAINEYVQTKKEIAIRAALTRHLVLSTLHANTAVRAISRLLDMNVPGYLLISSVVGVGSQRLVRRLCPHCKEGKKAEIGEKQALGISVEQEVTVYKSVVCNRCGNQGYKGRVWVYEILMLDREMINLINSDAKEDEILEMTKNNGMKVLKDDAVFKVIIISI